MMQAKPFGYARVDPSRSAATDATAPVPALDEVLPSTPPEQAATHWGAFDLQAGPAVRAPDAAVAIPVRAPLATAPARRPRRHRYAAAVMVMAVMVWVGLFVRDATAVSKILSRDAGAQSVLVCLEGRIHYSEPGLWSRLTGQGVFSCTEWRQQRGFGELTLR